jgi:TP901 family phage tail tape measure protein
MLYACVEAAMEFEKAMAGVRRSVGGSDTEIAAMSDSIKAMSETIPMSTTEIAKISETAGQLGIAQENIIAFTEVMAKLGTATDLTSEEAATSLAQLATITKLDPSNYERLASTIAYMGDSTAATAKTITEMSLRIASSGSVAGFTEKDIIALSSAVGGLGIQVEAGGTAVSRLITMLQMAVETGEGLSDFARVANMSEESFSNMWNDSAVSALNAFIQGLNDTERNGKTAIATLDELGISEIRLTRAILALAESGDLLPKTIEQANQAWNENTALSEKAGIMYETTAAKMQLLDNAFNQTKVSVGDALAPMFNWAVDGLTDLAKSAADFAESNKWIIQALTPLIAVAGIATAGIVAYAGAMKTIKALELPKYFGQAVNFFKGLGKLVFWVCCPTYHRVCHNRGALLISCRALEEYRPLYAVA